MGGGKERESGKEDLTSKVRIVAIEYTGAGTTPLMPVLIGKDFNPELTKLIEKEIKTTENEIKQVLAGKLGDPALSRAKHGRPGARKRSQRELREIGKTLVPLYEERLRILKGETAGKITVCLDPAGNVVKVSTTRMSEEEAYKWQPIFDASRKITDEKALGLIVEAYEDLTQNRGENKTGQPSYSADFRGRVNKFLDENETLEEELASLFSTIRGRMGGRL